MEGAAAAVVGAAAAAAKPATPTAGVGACPGGELGAGGELGCSAEVADLVTALKRSLDGCFCLTVAASVLTGSAARCGCC